MANLKLFHLLSSRVLGRLGSALILLFIINTLFGLLPLQLLNPAWQLSLADLLRTTAPFALLGSALIYLDERSRGMDNSTLLSLRRIQKLAPLAALGFLLLIPLQINATWVQIRHADSEAQKTIRSVERRIKAVQAVGSRAELLEISRGLPPDWQPLAEESLSVNRSRLLGRVYPELARLRTLANTNKSATIQKQLQDGLRDLLLSLIYAAAFYGLRPMQSVAEQFSLVGVREGDDSMAEPTLETAWPEDRKTFATQPGQAPSSSSIDSADQDQPDIGSEDRHPWYP
jgi:hypothetical protein